MAANRDRDRTHGHAPLNVKISAIDDNNLIAKNF